MPASISCTGLARRLRDGGPGDLAAGDPGEPIGKLSRRPRKDRSISAGETHRQREAVEGCLNKLGADPSTLKDLTQKTIANVQGLFHAMSEDEVLKHALRELFFEQFEAASYRMLAAAAREAGEPGIAETCERIQREEEDMGDWLWEQMPALTQDYLGRSEAGAAARR